MQRSDRANKASWASQLAELGFAESAGGEHRLNGTAFGIRNGWPTLRVRRGVSKADLLAGCLGQPGPWKSVQDARLRGRVVRVFELPPVVLDGRADDLEEDDAAGTAFQASLRWGLATADGHVPAGWTAPARERVEAFLPPGALTVRKGSLVRQGELICTPERLAVRFPVVPRVAGDLPAGRRQWLEALAADAQSQWRLVRVGLEDAADSSVLTAEVDLTGVPESLMEKLVTTSLAALRWVLSWLVTAADFVADATVRCRLLESPPSAGGSRRKE